MQINLDTFNRQLFIESTKYELNEKVENNEYYLYLTIYNIKTNKKIRDNYLVLHCVHNTIFNELSLAYECRIEEFYNINCEKDYTDIAYHLGLLSLLTYEQVDEAFNF